MDGDYLDDHGYSREEVLDGVKSLAEDWGVPDWRLWSDAAGSYAGGDFRRPFIRSK